MTDPKQLAAAAFLITVTATVASNRVYAQTPTAGAPIAFSSFDQNRDGFISKSEFSAGNAKHPTGPAGRLNFDRLDGNGDHRLSATEYDAGLRAQAQRLRRESESDGEMEQEMGK